MKPKNILFDLDGTIIESEEGIVNSVSYALNKIGIKENKKDNLKKFIGPPLIDSFQAYYHLDTQEANKAVDYYRAYFSEKGIKEHFLYEGIDILLKELYLKNIKLFIATSKPTIFAKRIIKSYKIDHLFQQIIGSNLDNTRKDKSEIISYVINENQLSTDETIMIGDRCFDIIGATKNGIKSVGVTYGHGNKKELKNAKATYIVNTIKELNQLLS